MSDPLPSSLAAVPAPTPVQRAASWLFVLANVVVPPVIVALPFVQAPEIDEDPSASAWLWLLPVAIFLMTTVPALVALRGLVRTGRSRTLVRLATAQLALSQVALFHNIHHIATNGVGRPIGIAAWGVLCLVVAAGNRTGRDRGAR